MITKWNFELEWLAKEIDSLLMCLLLVDRRSVLRTFLCPVLRSEVILRVIVFVALHLLLLIPLGNEVIVLDLIVAIEPARLPLLKLLFHAL